MQATIHQAKTHLSKLIQKALNGEEVVIAKRDQPLVRLEALTGTRTSRRVGGLKHWSKKSGAKFDDSKRNREIERQFNRADPEDPLFWK